MQGNYGGPASAAGGEVYARGGFGGSGPFGGAGSSAQIAGSGGGAGGYIEALIYSPAASYSYTVGNGGAGGSTSGGSVALVVPA